MKTGPTACSHAPHKIEAYESCANLASSAPPDPCGGPVLMVKETTNIATPVIAESPLNRQNRRVAILSFISVSPMTCQSSALHPPIRNLNQISRRILSIRKLHPIRPMHHTEPQPIPLPSRLEPLHTLHAKHHLHGRPALLRFGGQMPRNAAAAIVAGQLNPLLRGPGKPPQPKMPLIKRGNARDILHIKNDAGNPYSSHVGLLPVLSTMSYPP